MKETLADLPPEVLLLELRGLLKEIHKAVVACQEITEFEIKERELIQERSEDFLKVLANIRSPQESPVEQPDKSAQTTSSERKKSSQNKSSSSSSKKGGDHE